ncbi:rRNA (guanine-N1)-methyltransferase [Sphaerisporangium rubeum]|uniref:23S rRNA (Guanine745-N1)-methyltransferase n=1 Tax=Sphaerisporangium rubeum TaxID=321317 RepID=A0A7X0ICH8_9ACTN|nr:methyltransferase domain-containing protein [Sphaerisporangium rubeum]MBB6471147.1 23S rRNA (guanine745-N1)-methyltransferase [Sphaerisporangium rubeum]
MLADVIEHLACPVCRGDLTLAGGTARCLNGHAFDVARQGYVSLRTGSAPAGTADTPAMVEARAAFLGAGHFAPVAARLRELAESAHVVLDAGAGTGYHLATALRPEAAGIALDISKHALRRAARAHPRIGAAVADVWRPLPVKDARADLLLNVFAPRNGPEFARVLAPGGTLAVVTPTSRHLSPLVGRLGLLSVGEDKERRLGETLSGRFTEAEHMIEEYEISLGHEDVEAAVAMGPSAWHTDPVARKIAISRLPDVLAVNVSCRISVFRKIT